jgi:hypothetical protein
VAGFKSNLESRARDVLFKTAAEPANDFENEFQLPLDVTGWSM